MPVDDPAKAEWIDRVLGIKLPATQGETGVQPESLALRQVAACRLEWKKLPAQVASQVASLQRQILDEYRNDPDFDEDDLEEIVQAVPQISEWVAPIDDTLGEIMDDIINAQPGPERARIQKLAIAQADALTSFVSSDPEFLMADSNEYGSIGIRSLVLDALKRARDALAGGK